MATGALPAGVRWWRVIISGPLYTATGANTAPRPTTARLMNVPQNRHPFFPGEKSRRQKVARPPLVRQSRRRLWLTEAALTATGREIWSCFYYDALLMRKRPPRDQGILTGIHYVFRTSFSLFAAVKPAPENERVCPTALSGSLENNLSQTWDSP